MSERKIKLPTAAAIGLVSAQIRIVAMREARDEEMRAVIAEGETVLDAARLARLLVPAAREFADIAAWCGVDDAAPVEHQSQWQAALVKLRALLARVEL